MTFHNLFYHQPTLQLALERDGTKLKNSTEGYNYRYRTVLYWSISILFWQVRVHCTVLYGTEVSRS